MTSRERYHPINMEYASPDGIRPNTNLIQRARENFNKQFNRIPRLHIKPPSPSALPMPPQRFRERKLHRGRNRTWRLSPPRHISPRHQSQEQETTKKIVVGKNRTWKLSPASKKIRGKHRTWTVKKLIEKKSRSRSRSRSKGKAFYNFHQSKLHTRKYVLYFLILNHQDVFLVYFCYLCHHIEFVLFEPFPFHNLRLPY